LLSEEWCWLLLDTRLVDAAPGEPLNAVRLSALAVGRYRRSRKHDWVRHFSVSMQTHFDETEYAPRSATRGAPPGAEPLVFGKCESGGDSMGIRRIIVHWPVAALILGAVLTLVWTIFLVWGTTATILWAVM
jgi:hypothetical protein